MAASRPDGENVVAPDVAVTGWRVPDRERDRLVALHRVSMLVARQRRTDDVLREALQSAVSLVGGDAGVIHRWQPEHDLLSCVIAIGRYEPIIRPELKPGVGLTGRAFVEQISIVENDYARSSLGTPHSREAGLRTGIAIPISHGNHRIGVLSVGSYDPSRTFGPEDVDLLELFAAMVAVALENAELNAELESRLHRIRTLSRLTRLVSTSLDLDHMLLRIARAAAHLSGAVFATFWVPDEARRTLHLGGTSDEQMATLLYRTEMPYGQGAAGWVAERRQSLTIDNVFEDGRSLNLDWWRENGLKTSLTVPVIHGPKLLAVLSLNGREPFRLSVPELEILESFLAQAAAAIRNASLHASVRAALETQRAANEQLEQLNRAKSDFVSIVSHEFRSPLAGIQGFSELMRDEVTDLEEMREYAADINREAERLNRMIDELLDLDRMEAGRMPLRVQPVDVAALVRQSVASASARSPRHRLNLALDPVLPRLLADRDKLTQVLVNLLDNAIKYSPDGGDVVVGARTDGERMQLWVRDHGLGIPPDALETIFERYARVESTRHQLIRGTGLGLPIVRQIVELHGGRVWVESTYGLGSTFHVTLPLARPPDTPTAL
jgi:signal transduction histidine kinase